MFLNKYTNHIKKITPLNILHFVISVINNAIFYCGDLSII